MISGMSAGWILRGLVSPAFPLQGPGGWTPAARIKDVARGRVVASTGHGGRNRGRVVVCGILGPPVGEHAW
jgi:hypothetical protein